MTSQVRLKTTLRGRASFGPRSLSWLRSLPQSLHGCSNLRRNDRCRGRKSFWVLTSTSRI